MLATVGMNEADARGLSLPELRDILGAIQRREAGVTAKDFRAAFYGAAGGFNGGDAASAVADLIAELDHMAVAEDDQRHGPDLALLEQLSADGVGVKLEVMPGALV